MKKLLYVLCSIVLLSILAFLLCNYFREYYISYEIDKETTAKFEYKIGDIVSEEPSYYFRVFLGITTQGYYLTQEFYANGKPYTDPFLVEGPSDLYRRITAYPLSTPTSKIGIFTAYYPNGKKMVTTGFTKEGYMSGKYQYWYDNGKKEWEGYLKNNEQVGIWYSWDTDGNIVKTVDHDKINRETEALLKSDL